MESNREKSDEIKMRLISVLSNPQIEIIEATAPVHFDEFNKMIIHKIKGKVYEIRIKLTYK